MEVLHKRKLLKSMKSCKLNFCKYCVLRKKTKVSVKVEEKENCTEKILDYIHFDVWGSVKSHLEGG